METFCDSKKNIFVFGFPQRCDSRQKESFSAFRNLFRVDIRKVSLIVEATIFS